MKLVAQRVSDRRMLKLVRYADDFVILCRTRHACEEAERRVRVILKRLGLEVHPEKTRRVELYDGKEGFEFLGCYLRKWMSGKLWEEQGKRLYFLHRWPSVRSMKRVRGRVRELTRRSRCHADLRDVIADLNPVLRGWSAYFRTGKALQPVGRVRLASPPSLARRAQGPAPACWRGAALDAGVLLGPWPGSSARNRCVPRKRLLAEGDRVMQRPETSLVSRVREIRTHGLKGGPALSSVSRDRD
ncbi:MAG: group II intron maturase-specific domain-containing protein [Myxococcota bacterium]